MERKSNRNKALELSTRMLTQDEFDNLQVILGRKGKPRISKHEFAYKEVLNAVNVVGQ